MRYDKAIALPSSKPDLQLFATDRLHDLPHLHRVARGNFLEGYDQLIGRNTGQLLEHRPQLLQHLGLVLIDVAAPQNTVQRPGRSRLTRRVSGTLGIREEDHSYEILGDLHDRGMDPRDFLCDLRLRLIGHKAIFGDSGVQRHSHYLQTAGTDIAKLPAITNVHESCQVSDVPDQLLND